MSETDGVDSGQVAIQGHHSQDVDTDSLAAGIESSDYDAHGAPKTAGAINHKLVDEERHAKEKEEGLQWTNSGQKCLALSAGSKVWFSSRWCRLKCSFHKFQRNR